MRDTTLFSSGPIGLIVIEPAHLPRRDLLLDSCEDATLEETLERLAGAGARPSVPSPRRRPANSAAFLPADRVQLARDLEHTARGLLSRGYQAADRG